MLGISTILAFTIYLNAGVVRDVPELGVSINSPFENRNTEYIDQIYKLDKPFATNKKHVLVIGHSFARDFACILKEYDKDSLLELSYSYSREDIDPSRIADADYIFIFGAKSEVPAYIMDERKSNCKIMGIGTKYFGKYFGNYYINRNKPYYFKQSIKSSTLCDSINRRWQESWGKMNFIDMMEVIRQSDGSIPIFTPNKKVISFDCRHLTKDGCIFYSEKIDFSQIFD